MKDRAMNIFLMSLFSVGGIVILLLAWTQTMPVSERILATIIGSAGLLGVLIRLMLVRHGINVGAKEVLVELKNQREPNNARNVD